MLLLILILIFEVDESSARIEMRATQDTLKLVTLRDDEHTKCIFSVDLKKSVAIRVPS